MGISLMHTLKKGAMNYFVTLRTELLLEIFFSKLFWLVLIIKLVASFYFVSNIMIETFIPFREFFVQNLLSNPYDEFLKTNADNTFPYPSLMLWISSIPRLLSLIAGFDEISTQSLMFVYRIPSLIADLIILVILCYWQPKNIKLLLGLYWASPVLFYINYVIGQLDVLAMCFAFLSITFLFTNRTLFSALILGFAIATKMHVSLILPFVLVYLLQNDKNGKRCILYTVIAFVSFATVNAPYILSDGFIHMVFLNQEQSKIFVISISSMIEGFSFYIIPSILIILLFYSLFIQIKNRDLFLFFIGSAFSILLFFIPPSPGWYYWILPFLIYFYIHLSKDFTLPLIALQLAYFAYFAFYDYDFLEFIERIQPNIGEFWFGVDLLNKNSLFLDMSSDLTFTILQTMLLINACFMFYRGVVLQQQNKFRSRPYMIGISGDSGAGKTTLAEGIVSLFGTRQAGAICGDDMHRWERGDTNWSNLTHLNPLANELHSELNFVARLKRNKKIYRRHYNHDTGKFDDESLIVPRPVMILEGLHAFFLKNTRDMLDLKIFIQVERDLKNHRKVVRDAEKRGASKEKIIASINARENDRVKFIETQERHADVVVYIAPKEKISQNDIGDPDLRISESLKISLSNIYYLSPLISDLMKILPGNVKHYYDGQDRQVVELLQPLDRKKLQLLARTHFTGFEMMGVYDPKWQNGWMGVLQLFISFCIFQGSEE